LLAKHSITWSTSQPFFGLVIFQVDSHVFADGLPLTVILLHKTSRWDHRCESPCLEFILLRKRASCLTLAGFEPPFSWFPLPSSWNFSCEL
jgi:hypothetical protein